ncbi:LacI family DNA-binding transcriptional regulator [Alkalicoccus daliensis]|uniref:Transcriptional regulator, LacI family n=1 Tax=Alkalicoccus daliensis TaxID=745820 RepID=A0A1H0IRJ0_9BACI|nr:LacI family DNA-binding transcriptional regulator [Alkalicoccus daliensis]SDO34028.1 transcriptional regulator, LacI family [Alkalicoccus daliensis]
MKRRATIRDVAERAGVSKTTVSYVLNDVKKVSAETKLRVMEAMQDLSYEPDFTAISLTKRKSNLIGIILPLVNKSIASIMEENTYFNEMISAIEQVARENGFDILLTGLAEPAEYRTWVHKRRLDGLLFLGLFPESIYSEMRSMDVPAILIDTYEKHTGNYPSVNVDDEKGGYLAASHLLELGHQSVGFLTTGLENPVEYYRYQGYIRAYGEWGLPPPDTVLTKSAHSFQSGADAAEKVLNQSGLTAVICTSDITALGLIRALREAGKKVPEDFSVTGFDDIHLSRYTTPSITTVRQHIRQKGSRAALKLLAAMEGKPTEAEVLNVELVKRESTAPYTQNSKER